MRTQFSQSSSRQSCFTHSGGVLLSHKSLRLFAGRTGDSGCYALLDTKRVLVSRFLQLQGSAV